MGSGALTRGDVVIVAIGKPRPAVVVQADAVATAIGILLCPLTTTLLDAPLYRPLVRPTAANGLQAPSQLMADKIGSATRTRIDRVIGHLEDADMARLNIALAVILDLRG